ncbi:hypothetical protein [Alteribacillus sp. YIM 98480]|uniref:hypothetical protein n=1 Tax=Alteribacillus sp. YIM 98480 TaxID=2606599 RepID=UPI00131DF376|nr:hypothetical protein [Alteribacillus sp. YIM 98480]
MKIIKIIAILTLCLFAFLQHDFWFWSTIHPLIFGWLPVGFFYQTIYTLMLSPMAFLVYRILWDAESDDRELEN